MGDRLVGWPDRTAQAEGLALRVAADLKAAVAARGRASLAVPGGSTPKAFLAALAESPLPWSKVATTLTDERWVPPDHERSNERLVRAALMKGKASALDFVPLRLEGLGPEAAVPALSAALRERVLPLDVAVLGMGGDMHTASLFPEIPGLAAALDPAGEAVVAALHPPGAEEARITLTASSLLGARSLYLLIAGEDKHAALERAMAARSNEEAPVRCFLQGPRAAEVHYAP